ncbi:MAG TPA: NAD-dependent epimerase/dehydratase family protein [Polyangiaceae bacterium]|nr:NAD-dependent epimerase/dehydratase family protein [Polyangiaceae bacterium]
MKVLVTGAAGFIGSHVVDALCDGGASVLAVDSLDSGVFHGAPDYLNPAAEYCFADLRHVDFDQRFADVEAVVHLAALGGVSRAARQPANVIGANCGGTARLVEAMATWPKLRRVVLCSSFSVYGSNYSYRCPSCDAERDGERRTADLEKGRFEVLCAKCGKEARVVPITERATPNPLEIYGASKFMQELCFRGFSKAPLTILRFSSVYGTRLRLDDGEATIIAKIAGWIRSGTRPRIFEDGRQIRDWVYVGDIVSAARALLEMSDAPAIVNVCTGVPTTLIEACNAIAGAMHKDCPPDVVGGFRPGDMRHCLGDPTEIARLLGRRPLPLLEGAPLAFGGPT